jgi:MFS family permease
MRLPRMRRALLLDNRDFTLLWGGETLSEVGSQVSTVAYPLLVLALTGSPTKAGVVGLARWLPLAVFALPAGALADAVDRKRLMIACDAIRMLGAASIALAVLLGRPAYPQLVAVAFLDGGLFVTSYICERGALPQVVAPDQLQDAVAQNEARSSAAGIIGPSLGGVLFAAARALPFGFDAVSFLCSMTAIAATRSRFQAVGADDETQPTQSGRGSWRGSWRRAWRGIWQRLGPEFAEGFVWLRSKPFYFITGLLFAFGNPVYSGLYLLAILLARHDHASSATIGAMLAIVGVGGLLGAVFAAAIRRRISPRALLMGENWLVLGVILLLLLVHTALLIGAVVGTAEFIAPVINAVVAGSRIAAAPDHLQGRVQAVATTMSMSLAWLGPLAAGYLFQHSGSSVTLLVAAGWMFALAVGTCCSPAIRRHRAA